MTWFKVDDSFHSHPKAAAVSLAALGLWAVAGSWSGDHLTDGFVPDHMLPLLSRGQSELAKELCNAGLWKRSKGGYQFHQWAENGDGTKRNPSKAEVETKRRTKAAAGRKGGLASGKTRSKGASKTEATASAGASRVVEPPSRPDPSPSPTSKERPPYPPSPSAGPPWSHVDEGLPERMLSAWWAEYGRRTAQGRRSVHDAVAEALRNGVDPDEMWQALIQLGEVSKPVTGGTLQFALSAVRGAPHGSPGSNVVPLRGGSPPGGGSRFDEHVALYQKLAAEESGGVS